MLKEISLHILDIVQNSIRAGSTLVEISINEDHKKDLLNIEISDNGKGMDEETVKRLKDPFFTTRTTRRVGLGIPFFAQAAQACGGDLDIKSKEGKGTTVKASFILSHIDRPPLGSMADTMVSLIAAHSELEFVYRHRVDNRDFVLDTRDIKEILQGVPLYNPRVLDWIKRYVEDCLKDINGGV
jgi:hypothetical protein